MNWYMQAKVIAKTDPDMRSMLKAYGVAQGDDKEVMKQAIIARIPRDANGQAVTPETPAAIEPAPAEDATWTETPAAIEPAPAEDATWTETPALEVTAQVITIDNKETETLHDVTITLPCPNGPWTISMLRSVLRNRILRPHFLKNKISGIRAIQSILTDESLVQRTTAKFRFENVPMDQWNQDDFQMFAIKNRLLSFPKPNTTSLAALRAWIDQNGTHNVETTLRNESDQ